MQSNLAAFRALDTEIVAISNDDPERGRQIAAAYGIRFAMLSDPSMEVIDAYGLRHVHGGVGGDVARPATFILDRGGKIVWRRLTDNWRVRPHPDELLRILAGMEEPAPSGAGAS